MEINLLQFVTCQLSQLEQTEASPVCGVLPGWSVRRCNLEENAKLKYQHHGDLNI